MGVPGWGSRSVPFPVTTHESRRTDADGPPILESMIAFDMILPLGYFLLVLTETKRMESINSNSNVVQ